MPEIPDRRGGRFALEIDGANVGFVSSVRGGEAFARSIATTSPSGDVDKQPGEVEYEPIVLEVDTSLGAPFWDRITSFIGGSQSPMSGVVSFLDVQLTERARLEFTDALITEVAFPAADAGGKDPAYLRVTIQPESTRRRPGSGQRFPGGISKQRGRWLASNFRFSIDGLENAMKKVARVEPLVLHRAVTATPKSLVAGSLEMADVVFTIAATDVGQFYDWFERFVVQGHADDERTGSLQFLDASLKSPLIGVAMRGLGILRISEQRPEVGSDTIARATVQLYCEGMELSNAPA